MAYHTGIGLAQMLNGAEAFFSDTPPPGAALLKAQDGLPAVSMEATPAPPVARFDMGGFNL